MHDVASRARAGPAVSDEAKTNIRHGAIKQSYLHTVIRIAEDSVLRCVIAPL
ncbi:hypothetical protein DO70_4601 [Burkholderia pseudomallei]|nr:hypothetical protein DO70_4601 [Burkholderia pseudomallei]